MKEIYNNEYNLKEEEISELEIRIKALIIDGDNIILGNEEGCFQFIGGHLEKGESHKDCLKREVKEESGIALDDSEIKECILKSTNYYKDFPREGMNTMDNIYYYVVNTNKAPNNENTNFTEFEKDHHLSVISIKLEDAIDRIRENIPNNRKNIFIAPNMIEAIKEYLKR